MRHRIRSYWRHALPYALIFLPFFAVGLLAGSFPGYHAYRYVWMNAGFCTSCHVHDYASFSWKGSAHGRLTTCHDCHHQPLHVYMWEPIALALYHPKFPKDLKHTPHVPQHLCESCHVSGQDISTVTGPLGPKEILKVPKVDNLYLHRVHLAAETQLPLVSEFNASQSASEVKAMFNGPQHPLPNGLKRSITCTDCHGGPTNRAHNFSATDTSCVRCHSAQHKTKVPSEQGCRNCHFQEFLLPVAPLISHPAGKNIQSAS